MLALSFSLVSGSPTAWTPSVMKSVAFIWCGVGRSRQSAGARSPRNGIALEQLQGPLADAMTQVGQLAMLRRLAGRLCVLRISSTRRFSPVTLAQIKQCLPHQILSGIRICRHRCPASDCLRTGIRSERSRRAPQESWLGRLTESTRLTHSFPYNRYDG
jgi:hypothetical protein